MVYSYWSAMVQHVNGTCRGNIEGFFKIREYIHFIFNIEAIAPEIMQSRYDEQENS